MGAHCQVQVAAVPQTVWDCALQTNSSSDRAAMALASFPFSVSNTSLAFLEYLNNIYSCRMCTLWPCIDPHCNAPNASVSFYFKGTLSQGKNKY